MTHRFASLGSPFPSMFPTVSFAGVRPLECSWLGFIHADLGWSLEHCNLGFPDWLVVFVHWSSEYFLVPVLVPSTFYLQPSLRSVFVCLQLSLRFVPVCSSFAPFQSFQWYSKAPTFPLFAL